MYKNNFQIFSNPEYHILSLTAQLLCLVHMLTYVNKYIEQYILYIICAFDKHCKIKKVSSPLF